MRYKSRNMGQVYSEENSKRQNEDVVQQAKGEIRQILSKKTVIGILI